MKLLNGGNTMSYYCSISFKSIRPNEIQDFMGEFKQFVTDHIPEIAKENYSYCPYIRATLNVPKKFGDVSRQDRQMAEYWARSSVFQYRYMYDSKRQLLCLFGTPNCSHELFDGTVDFQNSTDQDYSRDAYEGIQVFEDIFDKWQGKSDIEILKYYHNTYGGTLYDNASSQSQLEEAIAYYKRTAAYNEIWSNYEDALYDDKSAVYLSLYGFYDGLTIDRFVKACHDEQVASQHESERIVQEMREGKHPELQAIVDKYIERHAAENDEPESEL